MVTAYLVLLGLLAAERIYELRLSRRNAERALARGGIEVGQAHFRWMRVLHTAFFVSCALEVVLLRREIDLRLAIPMFALALAAQGLRYWAIATLGERWNVRVIVVPGQPVETGGPYRWLRHPNYLAVVIEGFAVPLMGGAWLSAIAFTVLNAWLLRVRIRAEEDALAQHCEFERRLGDRPRLVPIRAGR
ncbi:MAG TPA: isoprenylcysteine carboxylmethyltransferase family protein [Myxococcota bacterium]|nr:isoprenylcysteine carboxylmethyltransferase family protein [Myxococcota bacterium]